MAWMKTSVIFACRVSHAEYLTLIDPTNPVGQLLLSHIIAVITLMPFVGQDERVSRKELQFLDGMVRWLDSLHANIEPNMRGYFEWPIRRTKEVREWLQRQRALARAYGYFESFGSINTIVRCQAFTGLSGP